MKKTPKLIIYEYDFINARRGRELGRAYCIGMDGPEMVFKMRKPVCCKHIFIRPMNCGDAPIGFAGN